MKILEESERPDGVVVQTVRNDDGEEFETELGWSEGETCGRGGCDGILKAHDVEGCSCHLDAPCAPCVTPREYCPECDWDARFDNE